MRKTLLLALAMIGGVAMRTDGKDEGSYLRDITMDHKTPHLEWAQKLSGEKMNALFITPRKGGREIVEACQRMGMGFQAVTTFNAGILAKEDMYESSVEGTTVFEKTSELLQKLEKDYNVIVLGNFAFDSLPQEAQFKILSKVSNGAGLVMTYTSAGSRLKKIFSKPVDEAGKILSLAPVKGMPSSIEKIPAATLLRTYSFGEGRIALVNYGPGSIDLSLTPMNKFSRTWRAEYENSMVFVLRTMLWAAGKTPATNLSCPELASSSELAPGPFSVRIQADGGAVKNVSARLRNTKNEILLEKKLTVSNGRASLDIPPLPAGRHFLDVRAEDGKGVDNLGCFCFTIKSPVGKAGIDTGDKESFKPDEQVKGVFEMESPLPGKGRLEVRLMDSPYGRVWARESADVKPGQTKVEFKIPKIRMPTIAGHLECALFEGDAEICSVDKPLFFPDRRRDVYIQIAWDTVRPGLAPFYAEQVVDNLGWDAGLSHPSKDGENAREAAMFNQRFVTYITRVGLTVDEKTKGQKQYSWFILKPEDQKIAEKVEDQSFYNPQIREFWAKGIENRIKNLPKYGPALYNLGDENFFNQANSFSPADEAEFKSFLMKRYDGRIEALNSTWGTDYKSFDEARANLKEAKEKGMFPAWFDVRLFWEKQYADIHHFLAKEIKKHDPEALVGAEGSVPGNLEETIKGLEFWGPYSDTVMDEVLRSIGGDRVRTLWWGGYVGGSHFGRNSLPTPLWRFLLTGTTNGSAWYNADLAACDGMVGADMSYAKYFQTMVPHMDALRKGVAQLLISTPLEDNGVAVLHSHASDSARLLDPRLVNPKDSTAAFVDFCYSRGFNMDFLTESTMADNLKNKKILFLFGASAISKNEAEQIMRFVKNGGTVVADINPGLLDGHLKAGEKNMLEPLFGDLTFKKVKPPELARVSVDKTINGVRAKFVAEKGLSTPDVPTMQVRELGKGKAILLNFSFASAKNTVCDGTTLEQFLSDLLAAEKITQPVKVEGVGDDGNIIRVRKGKGFQLVGILCGKNGLGKTARVSLPKTAHIYEAGKGLVKKGDSAEVKMDIPFKLLAIYEDERKPPAARLDAKETAAGKVFKLDIAKVSDGSALHIRMLGPDGAELPMRDKVVVADGKARSVDMMFAFTDKPGRHSVVVRDVGTGLETKEDIVLK